MECGICRKEHNAQTRPFLCSVDARNQCYELRVRLASVLIENDGQQKRIDHLLTNTPSAGGKQPSRRVAMDSYLSDHQMATERTSQIIAKAETLKDELAATRQAIESRRASLDRRKADLEAASNGLTSRRARELGEVKHSTEMLKERWGRLGKDFASHRTFLCAEAANLYGLSRTPSGSGSGYEYRIGKVKAIDLTAMNCELCLLISFILLG